jgi:putative transposase
MFEMMRIDMKEMCEKAVIDLLKVELSYFLGRDSYERTTGEKNYRNGSYKRSYTVKNVGTLNIKVPRDRKGKYSSKLIRKYERYDKALEKDIVLMFLSGLSTRGISLISKSLLGRTISASEVSNVNKELLTGIEAWRNRPLYDLDIKYMYIDGVNFDMRVDHSIEKVPVLVVIGITYSNQKVFLAIQQGDKESASTWRELFKDLKHRGLQKERVQLGIMDGLSGLEKVFREEFANAKIQRCQVHVSRNVLSKVPHSKKSEVADKLRDIFYASSRIKAMEFYNQFVTDYEKMIPSAINSLKNNIDSCLSFFSFPKEEWISLRTTNAIERVNKEFKRRTKPMEILAGEESTYRLLCFVALKMELTWRSAPLGRNNLPALDKFTQ